MVELKYNYVARFVELGVGRGQKHSQKGSRVPRPFITPAVNIAIGDIGQALATDLADYYLSIFPEFKKPT